MGASLLVLLAILYTKALWNLDAQSLYDSIGDFHFYFGNVFLLTTIVSWNRRLDVAGSDIHDDEKRKAILVYKSPQ